MGEYFPGPGFRLDYQSDSGVVALPLTMSVVIGIRLFDYTPKYVKNYAVKYKTYLMKFKVNDETITETWRKDITQYTNFPADIDGYAQNTLANPREADVPYTLACGRFIFVAREDMLTDPSDLESSNDAYLEVYENTPEAVPTRLQNIKLDNINTVEFMTCGIDADGHEYVLVYGSPSYWITLVFSGGLLDAPGVTNQATGFDDEPSQPYSPDSRVKANILARAGNNYFWGDAQSYKRKEIL